ERVCSGSLGRPARERVLHDREAGPALEQPSAQRLDLEHGEAAVVGDEERLRRAEAIRELRDHSFLIGFLHVISPEMTRARQGEPEKWVFCGRLGWASASRLPAVSGELQSVQALTVAASWPSSSSTMPRVRAGST